MAWLSRNNVAPTDSLTADMLNSLANDIRFWGGDVNAGGYKLTNVILSGSGGFERMPSPAVIAPVAAGGSSEVQLTDYVAGSPDTFPPRWKVVKSANPTADFAIERWNQFGSFVDKPLSIRMADGIVVLKAQQWTAQVNADGQTIQNVIIGSGSTVPWAAVTGAPTTFPPAAHTHAAADTTSGVFAVARLGSGIPDNTKFLRGDGVWSAVATQTPWTQDVDAAGFSLRNSSFIQGSNLTGQLASYNVYYDGGWKKQADGAGLAMLGLVGGGGSALYASPTVTGATAPVPTQAIIFRDNNVVEIPRTVQIKSTTFFPDDSTKYLRGDGTWQVPPGAGGGQPQTPWTQNVDAARYNLLNLQAILELYAPSSEYAQMVFKSYSGLSRWTLGKLGLESPESSGNAGSDFAITSMSDAGAGIAHVVTIERKSGYARFNGLLTEHNAHVTINLHHDGGNWRFIRAGSALTFTNDIGGGVPGIQIATNGTAGAVAPLSNIMLFRDTGVLELSRPVSIPTGLFSAPSAQFKGDATAGMSGPGVELFYLPDNGGEGRIQAYDRPSNGFKALLLTGAPIKLRDLNGTEVMRTEVGKATIAATSRLNFGLANGERICVYDSGGINHAIGVEPNCMWFQSANNSSFRWYVGRAPDQGATSYLELNAYGLYARTTACVMGSNALTLNAHYTDTWRYVGPGNAPAFAMYGDWNMNTIRIMAGITGTPGNAIGFTETMQMHPSFVKVLVQFALAYVPTSASGLASGSVWRDAAAGNVLKIVP